MSAPSEAVRVWHYDGASGIRRDPLLVLAGDGFVLVEGEREDGPYAFADLIAQGRVNGYPRYGLNKRPGWSVTLAEEAPEAIAARLPGSRRYGGVIDRIGLWPAAAAFAAVSALAVFGLTFMPSVVARMIPRSVEARLGSLMVGDFGERACTSPEGVAALQALATRMQMRADVDLRVVDVPMVNAVTLPGGHVVLFSGLLRQASSPDEVAGVLAHELGHVENRDVLESLVRQLGLSVVLGGLDGNVGGYTNALLSASYSRGAEARADGFAIEALTRAQVSPEATAAFFQRLAQSEIKVKGAGALLGYMASHPMSSERERRFAASAGKAATAPALDAAQWQALKGICGPGSGKWKRSGLGF
ncbi:M48 family metallopeptidase [Sphingomonas psychrotolerans]|uniref:M48 family metallopeptidase n=1 Tax=Sphingomonas psychrotolerans TaxID=1327635 RepID=A0ABU3N6C4_9SPHN|nr:M48 family metallopeptidase [Sphingomonas psychrotolerans]MDT8758885.1 M48 family metallopeptidase [Sphingomonas psychrotolerans]